MSAVPQPFTLIPQAEKAGGSSTFLEKTTNEASREYDEFQRSDPPQTIACDAQKEFNQTHAILNSSESQEPVAPAGKLTVRQLIESGDIQMLQWTIGELSKGVIDWTAPDVQGLTHADVALNAVTRAIAIFKCIVTASGGSGKAILEATNKEGRYFSEEVVSSICSLMTLIARGGLPLDQVAIHLGDISPHNPPPVEYDIGLLHACKFESRFPPCNGCSALFLSTKDAGATFYCPTTLPNAVGDLQIAAIYIGNRQKPFWGTSDNLQPAFSLAECSDVNLQVQLITPPTTTAEAIAVYNSLGDEGMGKKGPWKLAPAGILAAVTGDATLGKAKYSNSFGGSVLVLRWATKNGGLIGPVFVITKGWNTLPKTFAKLFVVPTREGGFVNGGCLIHTKKSEGDQEPAATAAMDITNTDGTQTPMLTAAPIGSFNHAAPANTNVVVSTPHGKRKHDDDTEGQPQSKRKKKEQAKKKPPPAAESGDMDFLMEEGISGTMMLHRMSTSSP